MDKENIKKFKNFLKDLFFPKFCLGCKKEGEYLCIDCRSTLDINPYDYCLCSSNPLRLPPKSPLGKCSRCKNKNLNGLYFALSYKESWLTQKLIKYFKYPPFIKELSVILSDILLEHFLISGKNTNDIWENGVLVPIPLHKRKLKARGYNQSEELAKELSKTLKLPVVSNLLIKIKATAPQVNLEKSEREKNPQDAFMVNKQEINLKELRDKKIFLVDDVYTTGSTMEECAKLLKKIKIKNVWGIAVAREG